jgi:hypothetical protein
MIHQVTKIKTKTSFHYPLRRYTPLTRSKSK